MPASLTALSFEQGAAFREAHKSTQIPQKELFWQGSGLPPTAASSSLLPSSIHLWGAAYSPSPTQHTTKPGPRSYMEEGRHTLTQTQAKIVYIHHRHHCLEVFLKVANSCELNQTGVDWFRQLWQDDICVMGGTIQLVCPLLNAVTLTCPHTVRWEEGVWNHSLCQAHNDHITLFHYETWFAFGWNVHPKPLSLSFSPATYLLHTFTHMF